MRIAIGPFATDGVLGTVLDVVPGDEPGVAKDSNVATFAARKLFVASWRWHVVPVFIGAALNPFVPPFDFRPIHFGKKIRAGAQFVQSQYCYDVPMFAEFAGKGTR